VISGIRVIFKEETGGVRILKGSVASCRNVNWEFH